MLQDLDLCSEVAAVSGLCSAPACQCRTSLLQSSWGLLEDLGIQKRSWQTFSAPSFVMPQHLLQHVLPSGTAHCAAFTASTETVRGTWPDASPFLHCVALHSLQRVHAAALLWVFVQKHLAQAVCVHLAPTHLWLPFQYWRVGALKPEVWCSAMEPGEL